jgi:hypothetical protein
VLSEIPIGASPITIGRAPDNTVHIDNLAVSDHHARLYTQGDKMVIEDLGSLNGTFVNDLRVNHATLRDGDNIQIGKHLLQLDTVHEASTTVADSVSGGRNAGAPQDSGESATAPTATDLLHAPTLRVLRGRTDRQEYIVTAKLTVIGRSEMASVQMLGWFAPMVGAQINHHADGYYLGLGDVIPKVNGQPIQGPTLLRNDDIIEVARVRLQFSSHES